MATPKFLKDYAVALSLFGALLIAFVSGFLVLSGQISQQVGSLHTKIDGVNKDLTTNIGKVEERATKLESAVKALGDNQSDPLKGLVHDLLAAATNALPEKPDVAARAIKIVHSLIVTMKKERRGADPEYFKTTISAMDELNNRIPVAKSVGGIQKPQLRAALYATRISLADYRSAIEPTPQIAGLTWLIYTPNSVAGVGYINHSIHLSQVNFDFSFIGQREALKVVPPLKGLLSENVVVENAYIKGGENFLDGIHWNNVVFIGARIVYRGGEVELRNVRFVNCSFDVPPSDHAGEFVNYAALANQYLIVPS